MSCYKVRAAVLFLVLGLWSCNAYATWGYSWAGGYVSYYDGPDIGDGISNVGAYAYLLTANDEYEQDVSDPYETWAEVGEDESYGYAQVNSDGFPSGDVEAYVEVWDGSYTKAIGQATAQLGFIVDTQDDLGSQITIGMDYWYGLEAEIDNPGDWAHGDVALSVILMNLTTDQVSSFGIDDYLDALYDPTGEAEWSTGDGSTMFVSLFFNEGDEGMLLVDAYSFAEASGMTSASIPAPGAMVLGSLGMGLVGWLRRRHAL